MKKIILITIISIVFIACKSDKKQTVTDDSANETPKVEVKEENVIITLNAVVPKNDTFSIQYTENLDLSFKTKDQVKVDIIGSDTEQNIVFKLPNKILPTRFMLKVGSNNNDGVVINKVLFNSQDRNFEIGNKIFFQFFNPNKYIDYNNETKKYTAQKVDNKFFPAFISRPILIERLEERVY